MTKQDWNLGLPIGYQYWVGEQYNEGEIAHGGFIKNIWNWLIQPYEMATKRDSNPRPLDSWSETLSAKHTSRFLDLGDFSSMKGKWSTNSKLPACWHIHMTAHWCPSRYLTGPQPNCEVCWTSSRNWMILSCSWTTYVCSVLTVSWIRTCEQLWCKEASL